VPTGEHGGAVMNIRKRDLQSVVAFVLGMLLVLAANY